VTLSREDRPPFEVSRLLVGLDGGRMSPEGVYRAILHPDLVSIGAGKPAASQPA
jgi:stage II sporulation protein GA (sporulation sigma-E factor processing peptidase)